MRASERERRVERKKSISMRKQEREKETRQTGLDTKPVLKTAARGAAKAYNLARSCAIVTASCTHLSARAHRVYAQVNDRFRIFLMAVRFYERKRERERRNKSNIAAYNARKRGARVVVLFSMEYE